MIERIAKLMCRVLGHRPYTYPRVEIVSFGKWHTVIITRCERCKVALDKRPMFAGED